MAIVGRGYLHKRQRPVHGAGHRPPVELSGRSSAAGSVLTAQGGV